jgi:hypothetical protein
VLIAQQAAMPLQSFLATSNNVIVEAMRREGNHIEMRLVECFGTESQAEVKLLLPHDKVTFTDLTGRSLSTTQKAPHYSFRVRPQQIVTLHFETSSKVAEPEHVTKWDQFTPESKLPALNTYDPNLIGHPPFGV